LASNSTNYRWWLYLFLLCSALLVATAVLISCTSEGNRDTEETLAVVKGYLSALQAKDIELARSYWTDVNNPGGAWTMVARRDMEHVTQDHSLIFAEGWEIVNYDFQSIKGLPQPISILRIDVLAQPSGQSKKLEVGLVKAGKRWYIYSIYPGNW